jgi:hypothetical protein
MRQSAAPLNPQIRTALMGRHALRTLFFCAALPTICHRVSIVNSVACSTSHALETAHIDWDDSLQLALAA